MGVCVDPNSTPKQIYIHHYFVAFHSEYISIGWESPAGQTYASAADLGKLMALLFSSDEAGNSRDGQVCFCCE